MRSCLSCCGDFVVPSRVQRGKFYALPQSPQQLKQLLMVAGYDRYYQLARAYRDEDLRGDRQLEHTQIDIEMSFVAAEDVMAIVEEMVTGVSGEVLPDRPIQQTPFPRLTYEEAMSRYGSDKPDLRLGMELGDLLLVVADADRLVAAMALGRLRLEMGQRLGLRDAGTLAYVWVYPFPMFKWDAELGRWDATHNPFSAPVWEEESRMEVDPGSVHAQQYDLALNGWELGGGSIRIHRRELLERAFALMGHTVAGMRDQFGALLDALEYGAPPHGGIAIGLDRWAALVAGQDNI